MKSRTRTLRTRENRETPSPSRTTVASSATTTPSHAATENPAGDNKRWLLRFQELETRLKAEQEGRALDQKGAKLRLDEVRKENEELRIEIKEKELRAGSSSGSAKSAGDGGGG
jgi:Micro-tubular organiser Mto1 C-term Mto2-binding region